MKIYFDDYTDSDGLASELGCARRTINRYSSQPDGLPYILVGKKRLYHIGRAREWLDSREVQPNPTRRAA